MVNIYKYINIFWVLTKYMLCFKSNVGVAVKHASISLYTVTYYIFYVVELSVYGKVRFTCCYPRCSSYLKAGVNLIQLAARQHYQSLPCCPFVLCKSVFF